MAALPVQFVPPVAEDETLPRRTSVPSQTTLGRDPNAENSTALANSSGLLPSPEEVEVHYDTAAAQDIPVYHFLDRRSGELVVQIPSEQMLNLIHSIQQQLLRMGPIPGAAAANPKGGTIDGDHT